MKSSTLEIGAIIQKAAAFISRFQFIIFFSVLGIGLAVAGLMILSLITQSPSTGQAGVQPLITQQQKTTAESLEKLQDADNPEQMPAPSGRFSPFFESGWDPAIMR